MQVIPHSDEATVEALPGVHLSQLAAGERMSLQHFRIEPNGSVDVHSHHHEQLGFLVEGTLDFVIDGERVRVGPSDSYVIPSEEPHGAENPSDDAAVGVELFSPPRPSPPWIED